MQDGLSALQRCHGHTDARDTLRAISRGQHRVVSGSPLASALCSLSSAFGLKTFIPRTTPTRASPGAAKLLCCPLRHHRQPAPAAESNMILQVPSGSSSSHISLPLLSSSSASLHLSDTAGKAAGPVSPVCVWREIFICVLGRKGTFNCLANSRQVTYSVCLLIQCI